MQQIQHGMNMAAALDSSRDQKQLGALHARFFSPLRRFFRSYRLSAADVEDLIQDVFLRLAAPGGCAGLINPEAFIFTLARNLVRDRARRLHTKAIARSIGVHELDLSCERPTPDQWLELAQRLQRAERALATLKPSTRKAFVLHRVHGNSYVETALQMEISVSMVEKHIMSAIVALRDVNAN
jgi:RNA polymerase sigma-70 factor (ECF subfamily)